VAAVDSVDERGDNILTDMVDMLIHPAHSTTADYEF
jgi:hypothetical protein